MYTWKKIALLYVLEQLYWNNIFWHYQNIFFPALSKTNKKKSVISVLLTGSVLPNKKVFNLKIQGKSSYMILWTVSSGWIFHDPEGQTLHENLCLLCDNAVAGISRSVQHKKFIAYGWQQSLPSKVFSALLVCLKFDPWTWIWWGSFLLYFSFSALLPRKQCVIKLDPGLDFLNLFAWLEEKKPDEYFLLK